MLTPDEIQMAYNYASTIKDLSFELIFTIYFDKIKTKNTIKEELNREYLIGWSSYPSKDRHKENYGYFPIQDIKDVMDFLFERKEDICENPMDKLILEMNKLSFNHYYQNRPVEAK